MSALIEPVDFSNAIMWRCSERARYITGIAFSIDAGNTEGVLGH